MDAILEGQRVTDWAAPASAEEINRPGETPG